MSGFSEQRQKIRSALIGAGMSADDATRLANALGNSAQSMRHSGDVTLDTTPADLRQVGPERRKTFLVNLDFRDDEPDFRRRRVLLSEGRRRKAREANTKTARPPQADGLNASLGVVPGSLTDAGVVGDAVVVGVRTVIAGQPPVGSPLALINAPANTLVGKAPRGNVVPADGSARLDVTENAGQVVWNLQMLNRREFDVVTKIEFKEKVGLVITYARIKTWGQRDAKETKVRTVQQSVIEHVVDDKSGLRGEKREVAVFSSSSRPPEFFNTFRVGTFTGGWALNATKTVTQVWPQSTQQADVLNLTQEVPDTPGVKYVLFSSRTEDVAFGVKDDPKPFGPDRFPAAAYYAIEIQLANPTSDGYCATFASLNGKSVNDLAGYNAAVPSALSYDTSGEAGQPCLKWRSHLVTVLTDAAITAYGLEFTRKQLYVLAEGDPVASVVIPLESCPQ